MVNDEDEGFPYKRENEGSSNLTDTIKKIVSTGVSAAFMTEESIRSFVTEMKLPKETLNLLLQGASKSKEELINRVSREVINMISKIDFVKEASRFVEEHKFRINAEIEVIRKEPSGSESNTSAPGATVSTTVSTSIKNKEEGD